MDMEKQLKAMAEPTRRKIMDLLNEHTLTAGEIAELCGKTQSNISHHLNILKDADLIQSDKQGMYMHYSLKNNTHNRSKKEVGKLLNVKDKFFQELTEIVRNKKCEPVLGTDSQDVGTMYIMKNKKTLLAFDYSFLLHSFTISFQIPTNVRSERVDYHDSDKMERILKGFGELLGNILLDFENKEKSKHTLKDSIYEQVNKRFPNDNLFLTEDTYKKEVLSRFIEGWVDENDHSLSDEDKSILTQECVDDITGLGKLQKLLEDDSISEIMVTGKDYVAVEQRARLVKTDIAFDTDDELLGLCRKIAHHCKRRFDNTSPDVLVRLHEGVQVHMVMEGISKNGIAITIRKFSSESLKAEDLVRFGTLTEDMASFLKNAVQSRANILVIGGGSTGKTTLTNVLGNLIPDDERIITIEMMPELNIEKTHVVNLLTRRPNAEGKGEYNYANCIKTTKFMYPDRILVDGVHDYSAYSLLEMLNNGQDGTITNLTASSVEMGFSRLSNLILSSGLDLPSDFINHTIGEAFDIVIEISRFRDRSKKITRINELSGYDSYKKEFVMNPLFVWEKEKTEGGRLIGNFHYTGLPISIPLAERLDRYGLPPYIETTDEEFQDSEYIQKIEQQLPEFCTQLAEALKSGHRLIDALKILSELGLKPFSDELQELVLDVNRGFSLSDSFSLLKKRIPSEEVYLFVDSLLLGLELGANSEQLLRRLGSVLLARSEIIKSLPPYKRSEELMSLEWQFVNFLDLLSISIPASKHLEDAILHVSKISSALLSDSTLLHEFCQYAYEVEAGKRRRDALNDLCKRTNMSFVDSFASQIKQCETFGTAMDKTILVQSDKMKSLIKMSYEVKYQRRY